jgi:hypothetical protein
LPEHVPKGFLLGGKEEVSFLGFLERSVPEQVSVLV